jgi:hypothetical protein
MESALDILTSELRLACALRIEAWAGKHAGVPTMVVGVNCPDGVPTRPVISWGTAGALSDTLTIGTVIDITKVVDGCGTTLWEGPSLGIIGARTGTVLYLGRLVDDPKERSQLCADTKAHIVDIETGLYAIAGVLVGGVRVVSDTPHRPLGALAKATKPDGTLNGVALARAFLQPIKSTRAGWNGATALLQLRKIRIGPKAPL